jgi:hypothetical protein
MINARVLSGTAQHNHAHMPTDSLWGRHGVSVFQRAQQRMGQSLKPQQPQHRQTAPQHANSSPPPTRSTTTFYLWEAATAAECLQ